MNEVARLEGVEPFELPPLEDCVDTESLDRLFDGQKAPFHDGLVRFDYAEHEITVTHSGEFQIE